MNELNEADYIGHNTTRLSVHAAAEVFKSVLLLFNIIHYQQWVEDDSALYRVGPWAAAGVVCLLGYIHLGHESTREVFDKTNRQLAHKLHVASVIGSAASFITLRYAAPWSAIPHAFTNLVMASALNAKLRAGYQPENTDSSIARYKRLHTGVATIYAVVCVMHALAPAAMLLWANVDNTHSSLQNTIARSGLWAMIGLQGASLLSGSIVQYLAVRLPRWLELGMRGVIADNSTALQQELLSPYPGSQVRAGRSWSAKARAAAVTV